MNRKLKEKYPFLYETHLHTSQGSGCGKNTGKEMALAAKNFGYTGIFVTDHNWGGNTARHQYEPWEEWVDYFAAGYYDAYETGKEIDLDVYFGFEAGFDGTEFLVLGVTPEWLKKNPQLRHASLAQLYASVKNEGGMLIHAHPFREEPYIPEIRLIPDAADGVEGINSCHSNQLSKSYKGFEVEQKAIEYARKYKLPLTAGSDIHTTALLGGGVAFAHRLTGPKEFMKALLGEEDYILTNGDNCYTRYGELIE